MVEEAVDLVGRCARPCARRCVALTAGKEESAEPRPFLIGSLFEKDADEECRLFTHGGDIYGKAAHLVASFLVFFIGQHPEADIVEAEGKRLELPQKRETGKPLGFVVVDGCAQNTLILPLLRVMKELVESGDLVGAGKQEVNGQFDTHAMHDGLSRFSYTAPTEQGRASDSQLRLVQ